MVTELELKKSGRMGFSEEDYAEWLRRRIERREDIQAHETALERMKETGLGERLGKEQEFQRPEQTARIGEIGARTAAEEFGLKTRKGYKPFVTGELERAERAGAADVTYTEEALKRYLGEGKAPVAKPEMDIHKVLEQQKLKRKKQRGVSGFYGEEAKPERAWHPWLKKYVGAPFRAGAALEDVMKDLLGEAYKFWRPEAR